MSVDNANATTVPAEQMPAAPVEPSASTAETSPQPVVTPTPEPVTQTPEPVVTTAPVTVTTPVAPVATATPKKKRGCGIWAIVLGVILLIVLIGGGIAGYFIYTQLMATEQAKNFVTAADPGYNDVKKQLVETNKAIDDVLQASAGALKSNATIAVDSDKLLKNADTEIRQLSDAVNKQRESLPAANSKVTELNTALTDYYKANDDFVKSYSDLGSFLNAVVPLYKDAVDLSNKELPNPKPTSSLQIEENISFMRDLANQINGKQSKIKDVKADGDLGDFKTKMVNFVGNLSDFLSGSADAFTAMLKAYNTGSSSGLNSANDAYNRNLTQFNNSVKTFSDDVKNFKSSWLHKFDDQMDKLGNQEKTVEDKLTKAKQELGIQ